VIFGSATVPFIKTGMWIVGWGRRVPGPPHGRPSFPCPDQFRASRCAFPAQHPNGSSHHHRRLARLRSRHPNRWRPEVRISTVGTDARLLVQRTGAAHFTKANITGLGAVVKTDETAGLQLLAPFDSLLVAEAAVGLGVVEPDVLDRAILGEQLLELITGIPYFGFSALAGRRFMCRSLSCSQAPVSSLHPRGPPPTRQLLPRAWSASDRNNQTGAVEGDSLAG
jgi:hypothetical protein